MPKSTKTPLLQFLNTALRASLTPSQDLVPARRATRPTRRDFLKSSIGLAGLAGAGLFSDAYAITSTTPRIAIIGGGLAGLNCAYQLKKAGYRATIYEASNSSAWGRVQTRHSAGLTAELGGEFIDSSHADMLQLAREFRLPLIDIAANERQHRLIKDTYFFDGREYSEREVIVEFRHSSKRIQTDAAALPDSIIYNARGLTPSVTKLDRTSIDEYLATNLGLTGWMYQLLTAAYTAEFGLSTGEQSALNFLTMIDTDVRQGFKVFGDSDERFKIRGGNARVISALIDRLFNQIETGRKLAAIRRNGSGYTLHFSSGKEVTADFVVLALPFTTLREVDLSDLNLSPKKREVIRDLGYGNNSKLLIDVDSRVWRKQGRSGYLFNENVHDGWDNSLGQTNDRGPGGYTVYVGGQSGKGLQSADQRLYLPTLDRAFPGFSKAFTSAQAVNWSTNPYVRASYACYRVGQWTTLSGAEAEAAGNILFCGEHCSADFQGFMNGAAQTGRETAIELGHRLKPHLRRSANVTAGSQYHLR
jgi:monoamine oxidase